MSRLLTYSFTYVRGHLQAPYLLIYLLNYLPTFLLTHLMINLLAGHMLAPAVNCRNVFEPLARVISLRAINSLNYCCHGLLFYFRAYIFTYFLTWWLTYLCKFWFIYLVSHLLTYLFAYLCGYLQAPASNCNRDYLTQPRVTSIKAMISLHYGCHGLLLTFFAYLFTCLLTYLQTYWLRYLLSYLAV